MSFIDAEKNVDASDDYSSQQTEAEIRESYDLGMIKKVSCDINFVFLYRVFFLLFRPKKMTKGQIT